MAFPYSDFLLTSFFSRSPIEMLYQLKYSAKAKAFSFLLLPGGPTMKILLAISHYLLSSINFGFTYDKELSGSFKNSFNS
jgi:hypothetical protein